MESKKWISQVLGRRNQDKSQDLSKRINGSVRTVFRVPTAKLIHDHVIFLRHSTQDSKSWKIVSLFKLGSHVHLLGGGKAGQLDSQCHQDCIGHG